MAAPYTDIQEKAENAFKTTLEALLPGDPAVTYLRGVDDSNKVFPRCVVAMTSDEGEVHLPGIVTGNSQFTITVEVAHAYRSSELSVHRAAVKKIFDQLRQSDLVDLLNTNAGAAADIYFFNADAGAQVPRTAPKAWVSAMEVHCYAANAYLG